MRKIIFLTTATFLMSCAESTDVPTIDLADKVETSVVTSSETQTAAMKAAEAKAAAMKAAEAKAAAMKATEVKQAEIADASRVEAQRQENLRQEAAEAAAAYREISKGSWTKKTFSVKGSWKISTENGVTTISLDDNFSTKKAPDLKIFLSPLSAANVSNKTAVNGSALISPLRSNKGAQSYTIPTSVNLSQYKSIIIHCEAYTKLWSAADL